MVDRDDFVAALAAVCTPVAVVTSHHRDRPHGTTVSAFCSLSLDPPMVLVSLDRSSDLLAMVSESGRFGVNVLSHDQGELAQRFARKGADKFDGVEWDLHLGVPRLTGVATWLACKVDRLVEGGDHLVAYGLVEHAESAPGDPLLYRNRAFGTLALTAAGA